MFYGKNALKDLLNLFLQSHCPLCQRSTSRELCQYCERQLRTCHLKNPNSRWQEAIPVFSWGIYGGSLKRAIAAMKYENQPQIAHLLGQWLGEAWLLNSPQSDAHLVVRSHTTPRQQAKATWLQSSGIDRTKLLPNNWVKIKIRWFGTSSRD